MHLYIVHLVVFFGVKTFAAQLTEKWCRKTIIMVDIQVHSKSGFRSESVDAAKHRTVVVTEAVLHTHFTKCVDIARAQNVRSRHRTSY